MKNNIFKFSFIALIAIMGINAQANTCTFEKDLEMDSKGEDVRCLQKYLREMVGKSLLMNAI